MKTSKLLRSIELAKVVAQVGLKEVRSGGISSRLEQAKVIAESLSNLKGAAMKAGQLLSLELVDYFPKEAIEILSKLQNAAQPVSYEIIHKTLVAELGSTKMRQLSHLDKNPVGIASIGQVHRARYNAQDIVLKVQYPGVATSIDSDLKILKSLALAYCGFTGREMDLNPLFNEFRSLLEQEVDYTKEAALQKLYRTYVLNKDFTPPISCVVPEVVADLSTGSVLAMQYEPGIILRDWISKETDVQLKRQMACTFLDLYFNEFFNWALVQTDSNLGNFLVRINKDSKTELVLLDFGACRQYSNEFILNYIKLLELVSRDQFEALKDHAIAFGLIDKRESKEAFVAFQDMLTVAVRPFFAGTKTSKIFDFSDVNHARNSQIAGRKLSESLKYSPPPSELVFLHRKLGGVYSVLRMLGVSLDVSPYWDLMLQAQYQRSQNWESL